MVNKIISFALLLIVTLSANLYGQEEQDFKWNFKRKKLLLTEQKGDFSFYWGYNRTSYAKSDIHLKGPDYNFILEDVEANDLPEPVSLVYLNPLELTIPQFNFRLAYHFNNHFSIAIGWDHMKYRTKHGSEAVISGRIDPSASDKYSGYYNHDKIIMNEYDLVKMEHSDGFNIININIERNDFLYTTNNQNFGISLISGAGAGIAVPWTNSVIFGTKNDDRPHFSGLGAHAFAALQGTFYKRFFLRFTMQGGFANMWDVATVPKGSHSAHAEQTIIYLQRSVVLGYNFKIFDLKKL